MAPNPADTVTVIAKVLAIWLGIEAARIVAPHLVILLAGMIGAVFALMSWRQSTRAEAFGYVAVFTLLAWLFAGNAAVLLATYWKLDSAEHLLSPVALGIAWIGHRWSDIGKRALLLLRKALETRTSA